MTFDELHRHVKRLTAQLKEEKRVRDEHAQKMRSQMKRKR
jgi:hypothetical protein